MNCSHNSIDKFHRNNVETKNMDGYKKVHAMLFHSYEVSGSSGLGGNS